MNARDRHTRIIESFGNINLDHHPRFHLNALIAKRGLAALTDEAIRELAQSLVDSRRRQNQMNIENRKRRLSTVPK